MRKLSTSVSELSRNKVRKGKNILTGLKSQQPKKHFNGVKILEKKKMMTKKAMNNSKFQNSDRPNGKGHFHVTVKKQCYEKLKVYSEITGYTMSSILETTMEEFFSKLDWGELISNYILTKFDNNDV